jgi:hypothetical protein
MFNVIDTPQTGLQQIVSMTNANRQWRVATTSLQTTGLTGFAGALADIGNRNFVGFYSIANTPTNHDGFVFDEDTNNVGITLELASWQLNQIGHYQAGTTSPFLGLQHELIFYNDSSLVVKNDLVAHRKAQYT